MKRTLAALLIVLASSACDNVEWGGVQVEVVTPGSGADSVTADTVEGEPVREEEEEEAEAPSLPSSPVLYMGTRGEGGRVEIRPVAEIRPDSLLPLPLESRAPELPRLFGERRMGPGTAFTLFAEGTRVGTLRVDSLALGEGRCGPVPVATGVVELVPEAAAVTRFVALQEGVGLPQRHEPFRAQEHTYDQRVAGLELAAEAISRAAAPWPGSVLETRADMQAIPLDGNRSGAIAGTFLFQDQLRVGAPLTRAAYGVFVLGTGGPAEYSLAHMEYRPARTEKAAMRYFEQADWDGDGETELLVEVFGEDARWAMALDRRNGAWVRIFEERCTPADAGT